MLQEKYNQKFPPELIAKAVKLALLMGGNMTGAYKKIEAMKKGLSKDANVQNALRLANESKTTSSFKNIVSESWSKNYEGLCMAMKLNPIQSEILKDYLDNGQIKSQYVGKAAGDLKASRIYAAKKAYKGSTTNRKEALYNAMKLNLKQQKILDKYISSGKVIGKYHGSMAGSTKETQKYAGMKDFKEHYSMINERNFKATLDYDMGDPRDNQDDWEDDGVFIDTWDRRENQLVVMSRDKKALEKWLVDVYGLSKREVRGMVK